MRQTVAILLLLLVGTLPAPASAQPFRELAPGTLVRVTTRDGRRIEGPLTGWRGDSLFLSTTLEQPEWATSLSDIRRLAYEDGRRFHGLDGAMIGAGVGCALGLLLSLPKSDSDYTFSMSDACNIVALFGGGIGGFIGLATQTPRWVEGYTSTAIAPHRGHRPVTFALRVQF